MSKEDTQTCGIPSNPFIAPHNCPAIDAVLSLSPLWFVPMYPVGVNDEFSGGIAYGIIAEGK